MLPLELFECADMPYPEKDLMVSSIL